MKFLKSMGIGGVIFILFLSPACSPWSKIINLMLPRDNCPEKISFPVEKVSMEEFDKIAYELNRNYKDNFKHIEIFKKAGILSYEGPGTCLRCHKDISVKDPVTKKTKKIDLMENLLSSAHYLFFTERHPNVYGFNGKLADNFPMGKIDRPCPKPGSFAMTAWAEVVITKEGKEFSEGCGQCHIGGQYQPPLGEMMPGYKTLKMEKEAIDCLICHSVAYDMNKKVVITDKNGRNRWGQDRSMKAALSVVKPTARNCLRCHQHNFGGDIYIDPADPSYMAHLQNLGYDRPRIKHPGSKRGTPYSPSWDVHAKAGLSCIDCHITEGHLIAKGTHTTTMMANDLPDVEVSCEQCHTDTPHENNKGLAEYLNSHTKKVACHVCHIPSLHPDNVTMRDFATPVFEEGAGIYIYNDIKKETEPGRGIVYVWWNGDATFLGNPIGDNPNGKNLYRFYNPSHVWPEFKDFDYSSWFESVMRPISKRKPSKIYPMKIYNGRQHVDLNHIGPFGGMYVPYNLPTYYATGDPDLAAKKELEKSMMKMMYGRMFDIYMMDKFMSFMMIEEWEPSVYRGLLNLKNVEARWLPNDAYLEISHSIRKEGAFSCKDCHRPNGVLDWKRLGYTEEEIKKLEKNPLE